MCIWLVYYIVFPVIFRIKFIPSKRPVRPTDSQLKSTARTSCCMCIYIYIERERERERESIPLDDGLQICPKHIELNDEIN